MDNVKNKSNGIGTAGFVLSLIGLILFWLPVPGWILWVLGSLFSFFGLFKSPRGLAFAGFIISIVTTAIIVAIAYGFSIAAME